jgi:hypothetical protein
MEQSKKHTTGLRPFAIDIAGSPRASPWALRESVDPVLEPLATTAKNVMGENKGKQTETAGKMAQVRQKAVVAGSFVRI